MVKAWGRLKVASRAHLGLSTPKFIRHNSKPNVTQKHGAHITHVNTALIYMIQPNEKQTTGSAIGTNMKTQQ